MALQEAIYEEPRTFSQIWEMEHELVDKIWFNRHMIRMEAIQEGKITIIEGDSPKNNSKDTITKEIWEGAVASGKAMIKKYGTENLGPYDDFEWGMLNGKLSALRWVLGAEWESLDT